MRLMALKIKLRKTRFPILGLAIFSFLILTQGNMAWSQINTGLPNLVASSGLQDLDDAGNQPADLVNSENSSNPNPTNEAQTDPAAQGISFLSLLTRGGWFMVPLLALSILVVTIGVERFLTLRREKLFPPQLINQVSALSSSEGGLDPRRAYQLCQQFPSAASVVLRMMLTRVGRPQAEIESAVREASQRESTRLNNLGSWLLLAAAVAPLIGLLGTVWGITQAFYDTTQMIDGQNRAEALAQGIYTALVTTMCGLLIAIPAAVMGHYFETRIINTFNEIEEMISNLVPQFERYEGKLRFTTDQVGPQRTSTDSDSSPRLPSQKPDSRPTRKRTPVNE